MVDQGKVNALRSFYKSEGGARRVALSYAAVGFAWILLTDWVIFWLGAQSGEAGFVVNSLKGVAFVSLSALLIYWLVHITLESNARLTTLLRAVVDGTTDAIFVKDLEGKYLLANESVSRFVGKPLDQIIGHDDRSLFSLKDVDALVERDRRTMAEGRTKTFEEALTSADGVSRVYLATKSPLRDATGKTMGLIGISRDITARKESESRIKQSEERLRLFLEYSATPIAMLDRDLRYLYYSKSWLADYNIGDQDITGRRHFEIFSDGPQRWKDACQRCLAGAIERCEEDRFERADGSIMWIRWEGRPWHEDSGEIGGILIFSENITQRKIAEADSEAQHEIIRAIMDVSPDYIYKKDTQGRYIAANIATARVHGLTPEEMLGKTDYDLFSKEVADFVRVCDQKTIEAGGPVSFDYTLQFGDVSRNVSTVKNVCRDPEGNIIGVVGISRDITERSRNEERLRQSEERYRRLVEMLSSAVYINHNDKITLCNPAFLKLVGAKAESEVLGHSPLEFIHAESQELVLSRIRELKETKKTIPGAEVKFKRLSGEAVPAYAVATPLDPGDGAAILVICHDLTEREKASALLRSVLESVKDAIITIDSHGRIRSINSATQRMFGYRESEMIDSNVSMLMPEPHQQAHDSYLERYLRTGESTVIGKGGGNHVEALRSDGQTFPVEIQVTEFVADGATHFTGVIRDMTDRRKLEDQFRQAQKMEAVGRLAGGVAHDFNNLLTVINGYSDILLRKVPAQDPLHMPIAAVRDAGERAAGLTAQLLAFSRKTIVELRNLDLNDIITHSEKLIRRLIGEDIMVTSALDPSIGQINADLSQLDQLIMNLAVNARDAMPKGGQLTIETREVILHEEVPVEGGHLAPGRYVELAITDTGCGMTEEVRGKIFEPFFTTKAEGEGTGLGLAVVYGVVKQSGGHIAVDSTVGVGTTFKVLFPAISADATTDAAKRDLLEPLGTETVLLVEDEASVRRIARLSLEAQGYTVIEAASGAEALGLLASHKDQVNLLLTDVVMPAMSGRQLAEELREKVEGLKVLFMSGYTDDAIVRRGIGNATDAFIAKPFSPLSLAKKVREVLDKV